MKETNVQQILDELKQAYPKYEISSLPTKQRGNRQIIIIKGFESSGDIDDWSVDIVYPLMWDMMRILEKHEGGMRNFRLLFIRNNQFVLNSPDISCGNVFRKMKKPLYKDVYGDFEHQHYVGECQDINDVIEYLTQTQIRF